MKNIRTKLFIIVGVLIVISIILNATLYCSFNVFPDQLKVNTVELKDKNIPKELNGVSILYFTDLEYGEYQDEDRTERLFKKINSLHPDVVIFGGDLFDTEHTITEEDQWMMINYLSKVDAPLGKFTVLGDFDTLSQERQDVITWIYSQAQFEILSNTAIKITNQSADGIQLIGIDPQPNYDTIAANTKNSTYDLVITHQPDSLVDSMLNVASIDLAVAGHSHGTQITFPIYGGYQTIKGATQLNRTKTADLNFDYIISTGIGCTNIEARLNATPEIYYFILKSKK